MAAATAHGLSNSCQPPGSGIRALPRELKCSRLLPRHRHKARGGVQIGALLIKVVALSAASLIPRLAQLPPTQIETKTDPNPSLPAAQWLNKGSTDRGEHHRDGETF